MSTGDKIKIAIVEDTDDIREALRVLINGSVGFECKHVYANAEDAITDLPGHDIDITLMDINLPFKNGIDCMKELKVKMRQTQFMMCTVYDDDDNIFNALQAGANGYLLKRTSPAQILEALRELNHGGSPMSSEIARRVVASFQKSTRKGKTIVSASLSDGQSLTERENEILNFLSKGFLYKEIADELAISNDTVKSHIRHIYEKLQVHNRTEALNKAFK